MSEAGDTYRSLLRALLRKRTAAGGILPVATESRYAEELDRLWLSLTLSEQEAIERELVAEADKGTGN